MGSYLNPGNEAFAVALNSEIYVDKTGLLTYTNKVMNTLQGYICNSRPRKTCSPRITARAAVRKKCFPGWKSAGQRILKNI